MPSKLEEFGESVKEQLSALQDPEGREQLLNAASALGEDAAAFVRKYPIQSVLGAVAIGFLLGASLGKKNGGRP